MKRLSVRWKCAANGEEAVRKWRQGGFHLVLMDIQLPVMNGLDATREIRRLERLNGIGVFPKTASGRSSASNSTASPAEKRPGLHRSLSEEDTLSDLSLFRSPVIIVALTASSLQSDRHEALAAGCNDFLTKVSPDTSFHRCRVLTTFMNSPLGFHGLNRRSQNGAVCKPSLTLKAGASGVDSWIRPDPTLPLTTAFQVQCKAAVATTYQKQNLHLLRLHAMPRNRSSPVITCSGPISQTRRRSSARTRGVVAAAASLAAPIPWTHQVLKQHLQDLKSGPPVISRLQNDHLYGDQRACLCSSRYTASPAIFPYVLTICLFHWIPRIALLPFLVDWKFLHGRLVVLSDSGGFVLSCFMFLHSCFFFVTFCRGIHVDEPSPFLFLRVVAYTSVWTYSRIRRSYHVLTELVSFLILPSTYFTWPGTTSASASHNIQEAQMLNTNFGLQTRTIESN